MTLAKLPATRTPADTIQAILEEAAACENYVRSITATRRAAPTRTAWCARQGFNTPATCYAKALDRRDASDVAARASTTVASRCGRCSPRRTRPLDVSRRRLRGASRHGSDALRRPTCPLTDAADGLVQGWCAPTSACCAEAKSWRSAITAADSLGGRARPRRASPSVLASADAPGGKEHRCSGAEIPPKADGSGVAAASAGRHPAQNGHQGQRHLRDESRQRQGLASASSARACRRCSDDEHDPPGRHAGLGIAETRIRARSPMRATPPQAAR